MTNQVYLALYKGKKSGKGAKVQLARFTDWAIRQITRGQYSHCEIAIDLGGKFECYSASLRDGGVRSKSMHLPPEKWDLITLADNAALRQAIQIRYDRTKGQGYDYLGVLGVILPFRHHANRWFCSEWCAWALGLEEPETYSPNDLAKQFKQ